MLHKLFSLLVPLSEIMPKLLSLGFGFENVIKSIDHVFFWFLADFCASTSARQCWQKIEL